MGGVLRAWPARALAVESAAGATAPAAAATTLERIAGTGTLTIGTRTGSPPFAWMNQRNAWVGKFFEIYDRWFGPRGERPYPMTAPVRQFMLCRVVPR